MKRRRFLIATLVLPFPALGQEKVQVVGLLWNDSVKPSPYVATLLLALNEKGYAVGRNLRIEDRVSLEGYGQMDANAAALVGAKVDLIVANGRTAVTAAAKATKLIPIVAIIGTDPVSLGLAASLSRPGGNVTGVMTLTGDLAGKRMELLKELVPPNSSVGILYPSAAAGAAEVRERGEAAAKTLGLKPVVIEVRSPDGIENAIAKLAESGVKGIYFPGSTMLASHSSRLVAAVARYRIPAVYSGERFAEAGALVSHGTSIHKLFSKAAVYADRILKGARPGDLPIEQPNVFDLTVNLKTARAQGIKVPQSILVRADKVIE